ncbi:hypothetical protein HMPREF1514_0652 [Streptococcus sp. AS20]|nr:hypothetical protein HMPREF1514_0652 [Streptococcus sp. AS20]
MTAKSSYIDAMANCSKQSFKIQTKLTTYSLFKLGRVPALIS